jgi:hypothetical protein
MFRTIIKNESLQNPCARKEDSAECFFAIIFGII